MHFLLFLLVSWCLEVSTSGRSSKVEGRPLPGGEGGYAGAHRGLASVTYLEHSVVVMSQVALLVLVLLFLHVNCVQKLTKEVDYMALLAFVFMRRDSSCSVRATAPPLSMFEGSSKGWKIWNRCALDRFVTEIEFYHSVKFFSGDLVSFASYYLQHMLAVLNSHVSSVRSNKFDFSRKFSGDLNNQPGSPQYGPYLHSMIAFAISCKGKI
eukprot:Gb_12808 [translate_table: standard]